MAKVKIGKPSRPLPGRGALNDALGKTRGTTSNDYAKAVPTIPVTPDPAEIQMLGARKPK